MTSVEESDVGILCYVSPLPGFRGILKQRYSDFIVNEVDLEANVVHLTSLEAPPEIAEDKREKIADLLEKDYATEIESFRALVGDSDSEKLKKLINQIGSGVNSTDESIVLSPSSDKPHRTAVHNFFKERLKFLVTDTVDGPDSLSKSIRVHLNSGSNNGRGRNSRKRKNRGDKPYDCRGSDNWPEHIGKFLRFHLYKENKDTQEALGLLGKMLGVKPRSFGFAGTKDKRSVSTQMVITEEDIAAEKYTIDDIALPLPGSRISYPLNNVGKIYHDLAKKDGISLTESAHNSKEFSLTNMTGAYRKVFQKPKDFEWELLNYTDANIPLAETDWDKIVKSRAAFVVGESDENEKIKPQTDCRSEADKHDNEIKLAVGNEVTESIKSDYSQIEGPLGQTQESQMALKLSFTQDINLCCLPQVVKLIRMIIKHRRKFIRLLMEVAQIGF